MKQQTLPQGVTTGHRLWIVMTVAMGLALGCQSAAAKECQRETPLPEDLRLMAPGPQAPEPVARFAAAWTGEWEHSGWLCHTLVVEEVFPNGYARVLHSHGTSVDWNIRLPGFWRAPDNPEAN